MIKRDCLYSKQFSLRKILYFCIRTDMIIFGKIMLSSAVKVLRKESGLTQENLALTTGVSLCLGAISNKGKYK